MTGSPNHRLRRICLVATCALGLLGGCPLLTPKTPVRGDINGDGVVDEADLDAMTALFGLSEGDPGFDPKADLNSDGTIGLADVQTLVQLLEGTPG